MARLGRRLGWLLYAGSHALIVIYVLLQACKKKRKNVKYNSKLFEVLLTLTPKLVSVTVLLYVPVRSLKILNCLRIRVLGATLFIEHLLKLLEAGLLKEDLSPEIILGLLLFINALI